jgi:fructokinase
MMLLMLGKWRESVKMVVWSVGEVLWDVFRDQERLGGAPLNFSANLQRLGDRATLLSAVGLDQRGHRALEQMRSLGLSTAGVRQVEDLPTGIATVREGTGGEPEYVIPRPAAFDRLAVDPALLAEATGGNSGGVDWLYLGTLLNTQPEMEQLTTGLAQQLKPARAFYDMNLRPGQWSLALVQRLSHLASVLKLNESEAETLFELTRTGQATFSMEEFCAGWASEYGIGVICVTLGPAGCLVYDHGQVARAPGYSVTVHDTVGSGDAFAAGFLHGYALGWPIDRTAAFANALGAVVASRPGATPHWTMDEISALMEIDR